MSFFKLVIARFFIEYFEENYVEILGMLLLVVASIMCLVYSIKLIIIAFQESVLWGLLYFFILPASLYFIITRWPECKSPFLKLLIAVAFMIVGSMMASPSPSPSPSY